MENTLFMFSKYRLQKFCTESFSKMYIQETAEMHYSCKWCAFSVHRVIPSLMDIFKGFLR